MGPRIALPGFPISGGCACGAVRYEVSAAPMAILVCCCGACQKITASAFSLVMLEFVLPLVVVTLAVLLVQGLRRTEGEPG